MVLYQDLFGMWANLISGMSYKGLVLPPEEPINVSQEACNLLALAESLFLSAFGPLESIACHASCKEWMSTIWKQSKGNQIRVIRCGAVLAPNWWETRGAATSYKSSGDPWPRICNYAKCPSSCWKLSVLPTSPSVPQNILRMSPTVWCAIQS